MFCFISPIEGLSLPFLTRFKRARFRMHHERRLITFFLALLLFVLFVHWHPYDDAWWKRGRRTWMISTVTKPRANVPLTNHTFAVHWERWNKLTMCLTHNLRDCLRVLFSSPILICPIVTQKKRNRQGRCAPNKCPPTIQQLISPGHTLYVQISLSIFANIWIACLCGLNAAALGS